VAFLLDASGVAELATRGREGCFGSQPYFDLLLLAKLQMKAHLFFQIAAELAAVEEHLQASQPFAGQAHKHSSRNA